MNKSMRILGFVCVAMIVATAPAWGCINTFGDRIVDPIRGWQAQGNTAEIERFTKSYEEIHAENPTLAHSNDLGVIYLLTGKLDAAIALFRATEKKHPGNARVAANLGTALELKGENDEALKWIRESVVRDVTEHYGSEWLHVRFLEAKIGLKDNPRWFDKNTVLGYDFGTGEVPVAPEILPFEKGKLKGARQLLEQINWQLAERMKFVKPPDPTVGDLLSSGGDLVIASGLSRIDGGELSAESYYEQALEYGAPHADLVRKRLARYQADVAALPPPKPKKVDEEVVEYPSATESLESSARLFWIFLVGAFALAIGGIVVHMMRRRRIGG